jgi:hypothetical protein
MKNIISSAHIPYYGEDTAKKKDTKPVDNTK